MSLVNWSKSDFVICHQSEQDLKASLADLDVIKSRISVCKVFEMSHRYINIQTFVWVFEFAVAFIVKGPTKSMNTFWKGEIGLTLVKGNLFISWEAVFSLLILQITYESKTLSIKYPGLYI